MRFSRLTVKCFNSFDYCRYIKASLKYDDGQKEAAAVCVNKFQKNEMTTCLFVGLHVKKKQVQSFL